VHNIFSVRDGWRGLKKQTLSAVAEHRISSKDLLVGFNIPADWAEIRKRFNTSTEPAVSPLEPLEAFNIPVPDMTQSAG
jgi:hypothetical protein